MGLITGVFGIAAGVLMVVNRFQGNADDATFFAVLWVGLTVLFTASERR